MQHEWCEATAAQCNRPPHSIDDDDSSTELSLQRSNAMSMVNAHRIWLAMQQSSGVLERMGTHSTSCSTVYPVYTGLNTPQALTKTDNQRVDGTQAAIQH